MSTLPHHVKFLGALARAWLLAAVVALPFTAPQAGAQAGAQGVVDAAVAERRVKAAYLYRFAGYVAWPEDVFAAPDAALQIGVWGNDDLADDLARLVVNRTVNGRRVEVRRLKDGSPPVSLHVLFVSRERAGRLNEVLASFQPRGILTVTEWPGALKQGSVINFVMNDSQIRFELSLDVADRHELKLSSRLVAVAQNAGGRAAR